MKFKEIKFEDINAQRVYENYINNIKNVTKQLEKSDRLEVLMEFNSHIYESLQSKKDKSELAALLDSIDKLGSPEKVLKPLIAEKSLEKATKSFNPLEILKALLLNIGNGLSYIVFFLLYLSLGTFLFLIFAKLFNNNVGMYYRDNKFQALGYVKGAEYYEVLGNMFIPTMLMVAIGLYILITSLLKLKKAIVT